MTSTKRTWIKRLLSTAAMATVAVGLLGAAAPSARADNDDWRWRHHEWRVHHEYRPYAYVAPGYGYPGYRYYAPPPVVYGAPGLTVRVPLVIR